MFQETYQIEFPDVDFMGNVNPSLEVITTFFSWILR